MMSHNQDVLLEINDKGIATVTLNRPATHNAFDANMIARLTEVFTEVNNNSRVRAMVLRSNGASFSAGADLNWMRAIVDYSEQQNIDDAKLLAQMLHTLYTLNKPTIARIHGSAYGGALGLIACCDIAIGSKLSKYCLSEVKIGLIPATISPYLVEAMGARVCRRYFQTAELFSARRARRLGLISECVAEEDLDSTVDGLLAQILKNSPLAVAQAKRLVETVAHKPIDENLLQETSEWIAKIRVSEEGQQGLHAFLEKRKPEWVVKYDD